MDDIAGVIPQGDNAVITLRRLQGYAGDANYLVWESYEDIKRMLIVGVAQ